MEPLAELICAYLDNTPGAADILNDALEEVGRERVAIDGTDGERLTVVLESLISDSVAKRASLDFAKHVLSYTSGTDGKRVLDRREAELDQPLKSTIQPHSDDEPTERYALLTSLGWDEAVTPRSSAAWAVWGALVIPVRDLAVAAQRAVQTELEWQRQHLKGLLLHTKAQR